MRFNTVTSSALTLLYLFTHLQAYNPVDHFTVSCGTTEKSSDGERTWTGDTNTNLLSRQDGTVSANTTTQSPTNQVPYTTARLSRSEFNYSFPVTAGPKFLRLFFYPAEYPFFPRSDASFTLQCNQFTLLNDFNASLYADAENTRTIFREYVVNLDKGERLNLSFTPSQPNSYAFINGIEVVSMPSYLYYSSANDTGFKLVGTDTLYGVRTNTVLETEYRIKVGGQRISPKNDTGLFRNWAGQDEDYLIKQKNPRNNDTVNITVNPDYVAPKELYRTDRDLNSNLKLIWEFPVDSGFYYILRLHFCELDPNITNIGDRVFLIYIGGELAEEHADIIRWSKKQKGLAVYKDYAVLIHKNFTQKKVNLSLQMHPHHSANDTKYSDPFLKGLEIFKIIESNKLTRMNDIGIQKGKNISGTIKIIVAGLVSGVVLISLFVFFVFFWASSKFGQLSFSTNTRDNSTTTNTQSYREKRWPFNRFFQRFSLVEIKAATNNFDDLFIVGVGGFGHVYKGYIDGISIPVAIKRLKPGSKQGAEEFLNEIKMLSQLRHRNLVPLIGYCNNNKEMILVYNFMTRGNLRDHLYNTDKPPLPWKLRLQICIDAAHGLHYLHQLAAAYTIIHSDVKTTNILLNEDWVAKVSDLGLSRIGPMGASQAHVSTTAVKGSFGYMDPEYYKRQHLTEKSDVYAFGVVLFEVLCGRPPLIHTAEPKQVSLANWVRFCYQSGTMKQIVDPTLKGRIAPECFKKFCDIGVSCLSLVGTQRPSMNDVVWMLKFALQLQESAED